MGLIKMPSEIEVKPAITVLIYGEPGIGKTTTGCSAPNAVLFDFDGGVQRINGAHRVPTVQVHSWQEALDALDEVARELPDTQSIIIDTAGKMLDFMSAYIIAGGERGMINKDGTLSLKGYGVRKQMFIDFNFKVTHMGKNVVYIAHEREEKRGEETVKRPEIGGSSANDLIKELDLVGYMRAIGKKRTITFDPDEKWYAKNTCNLPAEINVPTTVDDAGNAIAENNFLCKIIDTYAEVQRKNQESTRAYDALIGKLKTAIAAINSAAMANEFIGKMNEVSHIFNSKIVARRLFSERVAELKLVYDAETKMYADAPKAEPKAEGKKAPADAKAKASAESKESGETAEA